jgi:hypothetical protein
LIDLYRAFTVYRPRPVLAPVTKIVIREVMLSKWLLWGSVDLVVYLLKYDSLPFIYLCRPSTLPTGKPLHMCSKK